MENATVDVVFKLLLDYARRTFASFRSDVRTAYWLRRFRDDCAAWYKDLPDDVREADAKILAISAREPVLTRRDVRRMWKRAQAWLQGEHKGEECISHHGTTVARSKGFTLDLYVRAPDNVWANLSMPHKFPSYRSYDRDCGREDGKFYVNEMPSKLVGMLHSVIESSGEAIITDTWHCGGHGHPSYSLCINTKTGKGAERICRVVR